MNCYIPGGLLLTKCKKKKIKNITKRQRKTKKKNLYPLAAMTHFPFLLSLTTTNLPKKNFNSSLFFWVVLCSQQNWAEGTEFPFNSCPPHLHSLPTLNTPTGLVHLCHWWADLGMSLPPQVPSLHWVSLLLLYLRWVLTV